MEREWRTGFPKHNWGFGGHYSFEVLLSDLFENCNNKIVEAYFFEGRWRYAGKEIPTERVIGWRETFTCADARLAVEIYVRKGGFGISKENFADTLDRHIKMDSDEFINCEDCWNHYLERSGKKDKTPTPEYLLEIKKIAQGRQ